MTVGTLRAMLEGLPEDMAVVAHSGNFELNEAILSATARVTMMTEVLESFRDAFDGTDYSQKVWHYRLRPNTTQQSVLFITPLEKARTLDDSRTEMLAAIFSDHCELRREDDRHFSSGTGERTLECPPIEHSLPLPTEGALTATVAMHCSVPQARPESVETERRHRSGRG